MLTMDYRMVDVLNADQLEVDDLIGFADEVVKIISKEPLSNGFSLVIENEFGEKDLIEILDSDQFELFILE